MSDPIINITSRYLLRRHAVQLVSDGWTEIVPMNATRWSIRFVMGKEGSAYVSPFSDNEFLPGILLNAGDEKEFYLSREPALVGLSWYAFLPFFPCGNDWIEAWENTPVGT